MKVSPNLRCPCGSGAKYKRCCGVFHRGRPPSPAQLMRARYTAYAIGNIDFVMKTTHPDSPQWQTDHVAWRSALSEHCATTHFMGLTVHSAEIGADSAQVTFTAQLTQNGGDASFTEQSLFLCTDRWLYHSGIFSPGIFSPGIFSSGGG